MRNYAERRKKVPFELDKDWEYRFRSHFGEGLRAGKDFSSLALAMVETINIHISEQNKLQRPGYAFVSYRAVYAFARNLGLYESKVGSESTASTEETVAAPPLKPRLVKKAQGQLVSLPFIPLREKVEVNGVIEERLIDGYEIRE